MEADHLRLSSGGTHNLPPPHHGHLHLHHRQMEKTEGNLEARFWRIERWQNHSEN
jgi:hypothetical protein